MRGGAIRRMKQHKHPEIITISIDTDSPPPPSSPERVWFESIMRASAWKLEAQRLLRLPEFSDEVVKVFHTTWTEGAHHIREQIGDDKQLVQLLRHILPSYNGPPMTLFRGENLERWRTGTIGPCWTPQIETARMFGSGLNAVGDGGILLKALCPSQSIISTPSEHSRCLDEEEFTIDPSMLSGIEALECYPPA